MLLALKVDTREIELTLAPVAIQTRHELQWFYNIANV